MKKILFIPLLFALAFAQSNSDQDRMEQDLHVMNEILHELFISSQEIGGLRFRSTSKEPQYNSGFGAILYAPAVLQTAVVRVTGSNASNLSFPASRIGTTVPDPAWTDDSTEQVVIGHFRFFLQNYGDLASGLQTDEKVMLVYDQSSQSSGLSFYKGQVRGNLAGTNSPYKGIITASVKVGDIEAFRKGRLSEKGFQDLVEVHIEQKEEKNQLEYRVFGKILSEKLHDAETISREGVPMSNGDFFSWPAAKVNMKILEGLGATYEINWGGKYGNAFVVKTKPSSRKQNSDAATLFLDEKGQKMAADDAKKLEEGYRKEIPAIMLSYGRTLRKLSPEEQLFVIVNLPYCFDCDGYKKLVFTAKGEVLTAFDRNEISYENALRKIRVEEE